MDVTNTVVADTVEESSVSRAAHANRKSFPGSFAKWLIREPSRSFPDSRAPRSSSFSTGAATLPALASHRIVITAPQIEQLAVGFARTGKSHPPKRSSRA